MKNWYEIKNKSQGDAEIHIYDEIGLWGMSAKDFAKGLQSIGERSLTLNINSPGGSVFEGLAIYNTLKRYKGYLTVNIDGLAASIASVVALAGDQINIADNALFMIHNPFGICVGDAEDMLHYATTLEKTKDSLLKIYTDKTSKTDEEIKDFMDKETWFSAQEALDFGFVDSISKELKIAAHYDIEKLQFKNIPETVLKTMGKSYGQRKTDQRTEEKMEGKIMENALPKDEEKRERHQEEAIAIERQRVIGVIALLKEFKGMEDLAQKAIQDGYSVEKAELSFKTRRIQELEAQAPVSPGPSDEDPQVSLASLPLEERVNQEWERDANLRAEFGAKTTYLAFLKAQERGAVRIK